MHTTDISMCNRHVLATSVCHQNKPHSKAIRQYAKRTKALLPSAYLYIKITKLHQKIVSHLQGCLGAIILWYIDKNMPI